MDPQVIVEILRFEVGFECAACYFDAAAVLGDYVSYACEGLAT